MMDEKKIARINQLAAKSKTAEGLTPEEKQEQLALRREYIDAFRTHVEAVLQNTVIQHPDGSKTPLQKKRPN